MKKIYQKEWFGIKFSEFTKLNSKKIADDEFYKKFYELFYKKFNSYKDISKDYIERKTNIARDIITFSKNYKDILSIGCGNGFVENFIIKNSDKNILAIEPSNNFKWLTNGGGCKTVIGFFPECVKDEKKYEFGYCSTIDYVFNNEEYTNFLKSIYEYGFKEFYLAEVIMPAEGFVASIKEIVKTVLSLLGLYNKGQFWGYLRNIDEHIMLLKKVGFKNITCGAHKHGSYWIRIKNEKD